MLLIRLAVLINSVKSTENKSRILYVDALQFKFSEKKPTLLKNTTLSRKALILYADHEQAGASAVRWANG